MALQKAFSAEYVVQDDARQHLFWMERFIDPQSFPNDLLANYFQSVAPGGYTALYQLMAALGIAPLLLSKLLPIFLGLVTTGYCFAVSMQLFPIPAAGFITALLLNQSFWMQDDLVSASPRAFIYPLFLAFLYYLLRRSPVGCWCAIALLGLFYPPFMFLEAGILILILLRWDGKQFRISENQLDRWLCGVGLGVALLVMLPYAWESSEFGPVISAIEARAIPEFSRSGRIPFFYDDPFKFWLYGGDSGLMRRGFEPPLSWMGLLLPILLQYPSRFPLVKEITRKVSILPQIVLVSLGIFLTAHALLYHLFGPSRYTRYTWRFVMIEATGIAVIVILDTVLRWATPLSTPLFKRQILALAFTGLLGTVILLYPNTLRNFPKPNYKSGEVPSLYKFFAGQPKNILIASLSEEVDNLPIFSKRKILVGWEYANPYHVGYYNQIRQRATDLIRAQYSQNLADVKNFIHKYGVNFWMLDRNAFLPEYMSENPWFKQWRETAKNVRKAIALKNPPAIVSTIDRCAVMETKNLVVLQADCIVKTTPN